MGRRDRPLDESSGPLHEFAAALRVLREKAGTPTYTKMARATGKSRTALAEAAGGDHLPTWPTVEAYVRACDGTPAVWLPRWERLRDEVRATPAPAGPAVATPVAPDVPPAVPVAVAPLVATPTGASPASRPVAEPAPVHGSRRTPVLLAAAAVVAVAAAVGGWALTSTPPVQAASASSPVTVQNKVALGVDVLTEDSSPAYLSTRPLPYCKRLGCAVPDTDHLSGDVLLASCTVTGDLMTNYVVADPRSERNPDAVRSTLWYGIPDEDGAVGYLSEVYLAPASRGGLGLPACS